MRGSFLVLGEEDYELLDEALTLLRSTLSPEDPKRERITMRISKLRKKRRMWLNEERRY